MINSSKSHLRLRTHTGVPKLINPFKKIIILSTFDKIKVI
jgi:hypothetical protein